MNVRARSLGWLCLLAAGAACAQTPPTLQSIQAHLQGPVLILRGLYDGDRLQFNASGELRNLAGVTPFSLSAIHIENLRLTGSHLEIDAVREGLEFHRPSQPGERVSVTAAPWDPTDLVRIQIDIDRHHPDQLYAALARVFAPGFDDALTMAAPDYWQPWLRHYLHPDNPADRLRTLLQEENRDESCRAPGVRPPQLLQGFQPNFSEAARMARYQGAVVVHLTVEPNGEPDGVLVIRPLGMGLDENAVEAVRHYQFNPATEDGNPIACDTNVVVSFRLSQE